MDKIGPSGPSGPLDKNSIGKRCRIGLLFYTKEKRNKRPRKRKRGTQKKEKGTQKEE